MQHMHVISINVGLAETVGFEKASHTTGICKRPVSGRVALTESGIEGDVIVDREHHGGRDQAIYVYSADDYDWWSDETGKSYSPGTFGENLTIRGLSSDLHIGDRLLIGEIVLEATAPRIPCNTLAMRMQDAGFAAAFRAAERPGIYFRVLNGGQLSEGDAVTHVEDRTSGVSVMDLFRFYYSTRNDVAELRRLLEAPVAERFRAKIEKRLTRLEQESG